MRVPDDLRFTLGRLHQALIELAPRGPEARLCENRLRVLVEPAREGCRVDAREGRRSPSQSSPDRQRPPDEHAEADEEVQERRRAPDRVELVPDEDSADRLPGKSPEVPVEPREDIS